MFDAVVIDPYSYGKDCDCQNINLSDRGSRTLMSGVTIIDSPSHNGFSVKFQPSFLNFPKKIDILRNNLGKDIPSDGLTRFVSR